MLTLFTCMEEGMRKCLSGLLSCSRTDVRIARRLRCGSNVCATVEVNPRAYSLVGCASTLGLIFGADHVRKVARPAYASQILPGDTPLHVTLSLRIGRSAMSNATLRPHLEGGVFQAQVGAGGDGDHHAPARRDHCLRADRSVVGCLAVHTSDACDIHCSACVLANTLRHHTGGRAVKLLCAMQRELWGSAGNREGGDAHDCAGCGTGCRCGC